MSAHRRLAPRGEARPERRRRAPEEGRRRRVAARPRRLVRKAVDRPQKLVPFAIGVFLLALGGVVGPGIASGTFRFGGFDNDHRLTLAGIPDEDRGQGLVYTGLTAAAEGTLCQGAYQLDPETCTSGPDAPPAGYAVRTAVAPVTPQVPEQVQPAVEPALVPQEAEIIRDEGGVSLVAGKPALIPDAAPGDADFLMGTHDVACQSNGRAGKRVQVLYLHEFGSPSRYNEYLGSIRTWAAGVDQIFDNSAAETGGSRHIRYVTTPQCRVEVAEVQLPAGSLASFPGSMAALQKLGYNRADRKYLMFADYTTYCGIASYIADNRAGQGNRNNGGPTYARIDSGCWGSSVAAAQTARMLGAQLRESPNASGAGHCTDQWDLLCARDSSGSAMRNVCPKEHALLLDCGNDDYFNTSPKKNTYLEEHWNVALSEFLLRGDGGDDVPDAPNAVTGAPRASRPEGTAPAPTGDSGITGGNTDGGGDAPATSAPASSAPASGTPVANDSGGEPAFLEIRDPTSTSVRLSWSAASYPDAKYEVLVDGVVVATTTSTRGSLIGMRPDTSYQVTIRSTADKYEAKGDARSAPAARPAANSWFVLMNSLTGDDAADLYAARTANGTPIVLGGAEGGAQQQWKLVPAGTDSFVLQSKATGKCVVPLDGNAVAGAPLVQGECTDASGQWRLFATDHGFSLRTTAGGLAAGVGAQRFSAARVLVLQNPDPARHQSWTSVPG